MLPPSIHIAPFWRRRPGATLIVLALAGLAIFDRTRSADTSRGAGVQAPASADVRAAGDSARYHDKVFRVAHVVDGDTLDIDASDGDRPTTRIRLWGVDSPETAGSPGGAMHFGPQAGEFARRTLKGQHVRLLLSPLRSRDKYDRLLAYVFLEPGGRMFNELLLETGHAYADTRFDHHYMDTFVALEKHAQRERLGLWAEVTPEGMPPWRRPRE